MTMKSDDPREKGLLPFEVIVAATKGEPEAMLKVMKRYEGFMTEQSKRWYVKPSGESNFAPDQEIYDELLIRLIEVVLSFKI